MKSKRLYKIQCDRCGMVAESASELYAIGLECPQTSCKGIMGRVDDEGEVSGK